MLYYADLVATARGAADRLAKPLQAHLAFLRQLLGEDRAQWPSSVPAT